MKTIQELKQAKSQDLKPKDLKNVKGGFLHFWFIYEWHLDDGLGDLPMT